MMSLVGVRRVGGRFFVVCLAILPMLLMAGVTNAQDNVIRIAAASSMRFILDDLLQHYADATGDDSLQAVYGSSGNLYRQIRQGAPYDLFLSADKRYTSELAANKTGVHTSLFAVGSLVLYSPMTDAPGALLDNAVEALRNGTLAGKPVKIAIANPAHAPFGRAAKEVLQALDVWEQSQPHLIIADSVSQAAQFARTGAVDYAFIAQSLVDQLAGHHEVVPQLHYSPLELTLAVLVDSQSAAGFQAFIESSRARESFQRYRLRRTSSLHYSRGDR